MRSAKHFLSLGIGNQTFKQVAQEAGMTPAEFKEYCQSKVSNYEKMHREYNETHDIPAEWPNL